MENKITFQIGDNVKSRWKIESLLGEGGFGKVYKAFDKNIQKPVALKFIRNAKVKNENEGLQILLEVTHKNVVKVFNVERFDEEFIFMVYEFIEGETLKEFMEKNKPALNTLNEIMRYLLDGLKEIEKIAWHRDIKLSNIMIKEGKPESIKILDLGIAKRKEDDKNGRFTFCGTPGYMPPEASESKGDESYDVFMAGVVYYELLTNKLPYASVTEYKIEQFEQLEKCAREQMLKNSTFIPRIIRQFVLKAIKLDSRFRFYSIDDMQNSFIKVLEKLTNQKDAIFNSDPKVVEFFEEFQDQLENKNIKIIGCAKLPSGLQFEVSSQYNKCNMNLYFGREGFKIVKMQAKDDGERNLQNDVEEIANNIFGFINVIKVPDEKVSTDEAGVYSKIREIDKFVSGKISILSNNGIFLNRLSDLPYGTKFILDYKGSIDVPVVVYYSAKKGISRVYELKGYDEILSEIDELMRIEDNGDEKRFEIPFEKWIGSDESGKGDYFGPLVGAAFYVDKEIEKDLRKLGVRDSKDIEDSRIQTIALFLYDKYPLSIAVCEIPPEKYNTLYSKFHNLNSLLAWCHARVIQDLAENFEVDGAIADQFGDESYIVDQIKKNNKMKDARKIKLIQRPKAESNLAVAAASIIARDRFLKRLTEFSIKYSYQIPKGAGKEAIEAAQYIKKKYGNEELMKLIKFHFKNSKEVFK